MPLVGGNTRLAMHQDVLDITLALQTKPLTAAKCRIRMVEVGLRITLEHRCQVSDWLITITLPMAGGIHSRWKAKEQLGQRNTYDVSMASALETHGVRMQEVAAAVGTH